jgi:FKBP-type peptidyl-prolyl cis-trans isomerase 2
MIKLQKIFKVLTVLVVFAWCANADAQLVVEKGKRVKIAYNLLINSEPIESTQGKEPLEFLVGGGNVIPGLENQMLGMQIGDEKKIIVDAKDAYGVVDPNAFKEVPKSSMPPDAQLKPGLVVEVEDPQGGSFPGVVWEVKEQSVVINFNHPLAGQTLEFDVKVVDIL